MDKPPTDPKPSAESEDAPERLDPAISRDVLRAAETCRERFEESPSHHAYQLREILEALGRYPHLIDPVHRFMGSKQCPPKVPGVAPVVAIGGVRVARVATTKDPQTGEDVPVEDERGLLVHQRIGKGRQWEGPSMVATTRWAIAAYDADPLDVAAAVIRDLPPLLKLDCLKYAEMDAEQVGLAIERRLGDGNLRSALIANRGDSGVLPSGLSYAQLAADPEILASIERADQANFDLLGHDDWKEIPEAVLRAILRELGHPRPDNVTRA